MEKDLKSIDEILETICQNFEQMKRVKLDSCLPLDSTFSFRIEWRTASQT